MANNERGDITGSFREVIGSGQDEVTRTIDAEVTTGRVRSNNSREGQRGTREGAHVRAAATATHGDGTGDGVITRERGDEAVGGNGCAVLTTTRGGEAVGDGHAAFELDLILERSGTSGDGDVARAEATIVRHLGDATVAGGTTIPRLVIRRVDGITGEGVIGREDDHTDRRFTRKAREAEATDDGRSNREHDARLGREARGDRQGDAAVRVGCEGLEGRKRTAVELDIIGDRGGEGSTEGAVAIGLHRARGDDGITGVGVDARETQEGWHPARGDAVNRAVGAEVGARLDEVGGARDHPSQGDAVRNVVGRGGRVEGNLRGGGAVEEDVARPGLRTSTIVTKRRAGLEGQRSAEGDGLAVGGEDGGVLDGDAVSGGAVDILKGELTRGDVVRHIRAVGADVNDARADLGQSEAIAVHGAVVAKAMDVADVEATARAANAGARRKRKISDTRKSIGRCAAGVSDGTEATDARAGDGQIDVVRPLIGGGEGGAVDVIRRTRDDFNFVATAESGSGTETKRAGLDLRAAREAVHAREDEDAVTDLDEADRAADAFLDVRREGIGIRADASLTDRNHRGGGGGVNNDTSRSDAADATAGEVEAVQVEGASGDD